MGGVPGTVARAMSADKPRAHALVNLPDSQGRRAATTCHCRASRGLKMSTVRKTAVATHVVLYLELTKSPVSPLGQHPTLCR